MIRMHALTENGTILGAADITCRKWTLEGDGTFSNDEPVMIPVVNVGRAVKAECFNNGVFINHGPLSNCDKVAGPGDTLMISPGQLRFFFTLKGYEG